MEKVPVLVTNFSTANSSLLPQHLYYAGGFQPPDTREWKAMVPTLLVVICLVGFAGNMCVIGILLHNSRKAKPSLIHSLILNLSCADLFLLVFVIPFRAAAYPNATWNLGWFVCKTSDWFIHVCMTAKSITIAVVAKACFMYASNPTKQMNIKHQTIFAILVSTWLVAFILPLPEWFFTTTKQINGSKMCVLAIPEYAYEFMSIFVKLYPIFVFCIPFLLAFLYFWKAYAKCQRRGTKTQNLRNQIRSKRLTVMLLSVSITFSIMWLPEWISWLWMWHLQRGGLSPPQAFTVLAQVVMFSISSVHPLIFLVMSEEFREGFKGLWKRIASKKPFPASENQESQAANSEGLSESVHSEEQLASPLNPQHSCSQQNLGSPDNKDAPVLPDVEQFWHERETLPSDQDNDPIPWEHQGQETVGDDK
ncbi:G-protein coupled receptor 151 [Ambystoma mexicanum]|uniref:G-protein coupled receptor 151 n=1 Tax=Ambystoma mexicanum TaxID=8296 RepID=UPI0037E8D97F